MLGFFFRFLSRVFTVWRCKIKIIASDRATVPPPRGDDACNNNGNINEEDRSSIAQSELPLLYHLPSA
jgi:hypothetical protein